MNGLVTRLFWAVTSERIAGIRDGTNEHRPRGLSFTGDRGKAGRPGKEEVQRGRGRGNLHPRREVACCHISGLCIERR